MRIRILFHLLVITGFALLLICGCKKKKDDEPVILFPVVTTSAVISIGQVNATSGGNVTYDGGGAITARGVCWNALEIPTINDSKTNDGTGTGNFTSSIAGLNPATTYFVRAYATNSAGTSYGRTLLFVAQQDGGGTITDIDGNIYHTVNIGTQVWMVENLNVSRFRNGDSITNIEDSAWWSGCGTVPAYCDYQNNPAHSLIYGKLYNWYSVSDSRNIAPAGWHVSSMEDWGLLMVYLYKPRPDYYTPGGQIKESDTTHWKSPNSCATNECGFTALPGGFRYSFGPFILMGYNSDWWNAEEYNASDGAVFFVQSDDCNLYSGYSDKGSGLSVRCVKD
jgi:uncharacterized protein (TIGR02145 family)